MANLHRWQASSRRNHCSPKITSPFSTVSVKSRRRGSKWGCPLAPRKATSGEWLGMSAKCRLCCKSRKLQGSDFFAKTRNGKQSTIRIISIALPKSPVSFARGDEVPHIFTRKPRLQPAEFLITGAKRLLQHNLPIATKLHCSKTTLIRSPRRRAVGATAAPRCRAPWPSSD